MECLKESDQTQYAAEKKKQLPGPLTLIPIHFPSHHCGSP